MLRSFVVSVVAVMMSGEVSVGSIVVGVKLVEDSSNDELPVRHRAFGLLDGTLGRRSGRE
jgi:hypothetical protein